MLCREHHLIDCRENTRIVILLPLAANLNQIILCVNVNLSRMFIGGEPTNLNAQWKIGLSRHTLWRQPDGMSDYAVVADEYHWMPTQIAERKPD